MASKAMLKFAILDKNRVMYLEVVDLFLTSLKNRFEQEAFHVDSRIEDFLLSSIKDEQIIEWKAKNISMIFIWLSLIHI